MDSASSVLVHCRLILPPCGVNLMELPKRLYTIRSSFFASTLTRHSPSPAEKSRLMPFVCASEENDSCHERINELMSTVCNFNCIFPFSTFLKSRIWLTRSNSTPVLRLTMCNSGKMPIPSLLCSFFIASSTGAAIRLRGVRKSCEIFVKNTSLAFVASSSSLVMLSNCPFCSISLFCCS